MKGSSTSSGEMQIKTTMTYYCKPTRMASSPRNKASSKSHIITGTGEELGKKLEPSQTAGGKYKVVQPLWKTVWQFLKRLNIKLPNNLAILPLDL